MAKVLHPSLLITSASGAEPMRAVDLAGETLIIGRAPECDVQINDQSLSHRHAQLQRRGDRWHLTRLPDAESVLVNGQPCDDADVGTGDQIVLGGTVLRMTWLTDVAIDPQMTWQRVPADLEVAAPRLVVRWGEGLFVAPLRDERITLGRDPQSSIIVPSRLVSSQHAHLLRGGDGRFTVRDDGSQNGLLFQGKRIQARLLEHGDTIIIGEANGPNQVRLTYEDPQQATLSQASGAHVTATIGRDPAGTYPLANPLVSWQHAQMLRDAGGQTTLVDLGSTNGTYVNYQRVTKPQVLQIGDRVNIGIFEFLFDGTDLSRIATPVGGLRLDAHDLTRTILNGKVTLLRDVTLSVQPGEFVAIAGGSGAGKTTLMRAMAGIQPAQGGTVTFNDVNLYQHYDLFRGIIGYVPQADIVHSALTVERALHYAANLRLAGDIRPEEIEARITAVLETVDLTYRRSALIKTLSGGERKRVNIAVELLADPPILFLDEPGAALDPNLRLELTETLHELAHKGRTIVVVTHHVEDIEACDMLAFMGSGGRLCYFGPPQEAMHFFQAERVETFYTHTGKPDAAEEWRQRFASSTDFQRYVQARLPKDLPQDARRSMPLPNARQSEPKPARQLSFRQQLTLLTRRYIEILMQDRVNLAILLLQAPIIGLIFASVTGAGVFADQQNADPILARFVLFFMAVIGIWFGASNAAREICKETDIYERERLAGLGVAPYLVSKVIVLTGLCVIQAAVLLLTITVRTGLPPVSAGLFLPPALELFVSLVLVEMAGMTMGLCVSAFSSTPDKATSLVPLVLIPQILLAGVVFTINSDSPMNAIADMTVARWAVQAMGTSADLNHIYFARVRVGVVDHTYVDNFDANPNPSNYTRSLAPNASWADSQSGRREKLIETWLGILGLLIVFLALAAVRLRLKDPT